MINVNIAKKLTENHNNFNLRQILYAVLNGKNECDIVLGYNLTEEELQIKRKEFLDLGYTIVFERCITSWGGDNREPLTECDPEYRAWIRWE